MQSYYRQELRKFHSVGEGFFSVSLAHSFSLPGSVSRLWQRFHYSFQSLFAPSTLSLFTLFVVPLIFSLCIFNFRSIPASVIYSCMFSCLSRPSCCSFLPYFTNFCFPFCPASPRFLASSYHSLVALSFVVVGLYPSELFFLLSFVTFAFSVALFSLSVLLPPPSLLLSLPLFLPSVSSEQPSPRLLQSSFQDKTRLCCCFLLHTHRLSTESMSWV